MGGNEPTGMYLRRVGVGKPAEAFAKSAKVFCHLAIYTVADKK
ncbi:MAG: hypothetical protein ACI832_002909 [Rheinheimera aquimaris]|jgi:hypothetical protein